jgi:hypothetical protein
MGVSIRFKQFFGLFALNHPSCRYLESMRADMQRLDQLERERQQQEQQQQVMCVQH